MGCTLKKKVNSRLVVLQSRHGVSALISQQTDAQLRKIINQIKATEIKHLTNIHHRIGLIQALTSSSLSKAILFTKEECICNSWTESCKKPKQNILVRQNKPKVIRLKTPDRTLLVIQVTKELKLCRSHIQEPVKKYISDGYKSIR